MLHSTNGMMHCTVACMVLSVALATFGCRYERYPLGAAVNLDGDGRSGAGDTNGDGRSGAGDTNGDGRSGAGDTNGDGWNDAGDTDGDGRNDAVDSDGDGWSDEDEVDCGTDPLNASSVPPDPDGDHVCSPWDGPAPIDGWYGLGGSEMAVWPKSAHSSWRGGGVNGAWGEAAIPAMAKDSQGRLIVTWLQRVWEDIPGSQGIWLRSFVHLRRFNGETWEQLAGSAAGVGLSSPGCTAGGPSVAIDSMDRPLVAWMEVQEYFPLTGLQVKLVRFDGSQWQSLTASDGSDLGVDLATDPIAHTQVTVDSSDRPVFVWTGDVRNGATPGVFVSRLESGSWSEIGGSTTGNGIADATGVPDYFTAISRPNGRLAVAWRVDTGPSSSPLLEIAEWSSTVWQRLPTPVDPPLQISFFPWSPHALAADSNDQLIVAWIDSSTGTDQLYAKRYVSGGWQEIDGSATGAGLGEAALIWRDSIATNASDDLLITWISGPLDSLSHGALQVGRNTGAGWQSVDTSTLIATDRTPPTAAIADDAGNFVVAWSATSAAAVVNPLYVARLGASGWEAMDDTYSSDGISAPTLEYKWSTLKMTSDGQPTLTWISSPWNSSSAPPPIRHLQWTAPDWVALAGSIDATGHVATPATNTWPEPAVEVLSSGERVIAWIDDGSSVDTHAVVTLRFDGSTWTESSTDVGGSVRRMAIDSVGRVCATVYDPGLGNTRFRRITDTVVEEMGEVGRPAAVPSGNGGLSVAMTLGPDDLPVIAWLNLTNDPQRRKGDLYLNRFNGSAWVGIDGSDTGDGLNGGDGLAGRDVSLVVGPTGDPTIAWAGVTPYVVGTPSDIFLVTHDSTGWHGIDGSEIGVGLSSGVGFSGGPSLALDSSGRPIVAWVNDSTGSFEIYLKHAFHGMWFDVWGSGTGRGISNSRAMSTGTSVAIRDQRLCVAWVEIGRLSTIALRCSDL